MKKFASITLAAFLALLPMAASAHETQMFEINGGHYQFVIGSLGEPVVVDDKSGVDLRISRVYGHVDGHDHDAGVPVAGLEETLKVELIAGEAKKTLDLSPVYNTPGSYKAPFFPTVATTLTYRVFGEIDGTPVDLSFSCSSAGHAEAEEDESEVVMSEGVTRTLKTGAFGCPIEKAALGFPEASASVEMLKEENASAKGWGTTGAALGLFALVIAGYGALRRK